MGVSNEELRAMRLTLKDMFKNIDLESVSMFRNGSHLLPRFKNGSNINIEKKNRGKFTESAKRAKQSVQEYATSILNNLNSTTLQKKRANFAKNAAKWNH